jgi:hypothetical protein
VRATAKNLRATHEVPRWPISERDFPAGGCGIEASNNPALDQKYPVVPVPLGEQDLTFLEDLVDPMLPNPLAVGFVQKLQEALPEGNNLIVFR